MISGGLAEEVDEKMIQASLIPFGDLVDINLPLDYETRILYQQHLKFLLLSDSCEFRPDVIDFLN